MNLEEAIKNREDCLKYLEEIGPKASPDCLEAVRWSAKALKALRPVSREQVEKVWRGELKENLSSSYKNEITYCAECGHDFFDFTQIRNFCPVCGKALTDEAVQMVMERLEDMLSKE